MMMKSLALFCLIAVAEAVKVEQYDEDVWQAKLNKAATDA